MPCTHFIDGALCRCAAVRGLLVPSLHERERFCRSDEPERCPTWRARSHRADAMPEEVYYALWLPALPASSEGSPRVTAGDPREA